jgi:hypothetical protein
MQRVEHAEAGSMTVPTLMTIGVTGLFLVADEEFPSA